VIENKKKGENMEIKVIFTLISIQRMVEKWNSQLAKAG